GFFKKDSLRVPKWYSSAPNGSGRRATRGCSCQRVSRSSMIYRRSVDAAHTVDGYLFDQGFLDQRRVLAVACLDGPDRAAVIGIGVSEGAVVRHGYLHKVDADDRSLR